MAISPFPTAAQILAWWPNGRGAAIVAMVAAGLSYHRAVIRTRRYFLEGKPYAG
jgi:hypothetical protein